MKIFLFSMITIMPLIFGTSLTPIFPETLENTYTNEKCGISINYPKDWKTENQDYKIDTLKPIVDFIPDPDDIYNTISINLWDISDNREKTIEYLSEIFRPAEDEIETEVIQDDILQIGEFPAQKLAYIEGILGEYEFQEDKARVMQINILAYDKVYQIQLEAKNLENFYKYTSSVEEMANTLKISKPNFEGINC